MLAINLSVRNRSYMIDQSKRKDLHEERTEEKMEAPIRRRAIVVSLIVLGIVIVVIAGGWYVLQPSGEGRQITIFTVSDLSPTTSPVDEHPGTLAQNFSLTHPDGTSSWLGDFRGKVVVINFMATWCGGCRQEMPHLKVIWEKYGEKIVLMSIDIDPWGSEETLRVFAQEFQPATWIWAMDRANLVEAYNAYLIPKTVIIDQDGYIRFTHTDVTPASTLIQEIDQLLG